MRFFFRLLFVLGVFSAELPLLATDSNLAVAVVYDTSGSMAGKVKDAAQNLAPKYEIANRALEAITAEVEKFTARGGRKVQFALYTFAADEKPVVPLGPFDAGKIRTWISTYKKPTGATPLGRTTATAARALLASKAGLRHILIITDGENTQGPPPEQLIPGLLAEAAKAGQTLEFHFVAFDVNAAAFSGVKKLGATLVSAADERQLKEKLTFVVEEKILLEKE